MKKVLVTGGTVLLADILQNIMQQKDMMYMFSIEIVANSRKE